MAKYYGKLSKTRCWAIEATLDSWEFMSQLINLPAEDIFMFVDDLRH